jgi:hypothetical protein
VIYSLVMAGLAFKRENHVVAAYYEAARAWWSSKEIYGTSGGGFLYLPQAAMLFAPFAFLPTKVGEACWRLICLGLCALALRRLSRLSSSSQGGFLFVGATLLVLLPLAGSATTGQINVLLGAAMTLAACDLARARWWPAALWLGLVFICKPPAIVMVLLAGAVYGPLWSLSLPRGAEQHVPEVRGFERFIGPISWRLAIILLLLACVPFVHPHPAYVAAEYRSFFDMLHVAGSPVRGDYQDLVALLESFRIHISDTCYTVIRVVFALVTLALCLLARARMGTRAGGIYLLAFAAAYFMVANPRTEGLTYCILAMPLVVFTSAEFLGRRWGWYAILLAICILLGAARVLTGFSQPGSPFARAMWVRPAAALIFAAYLCTHVIRGRPRLPLEVSRSAATPHPPA